MRERKYTKGDTPDKRLDHVERTLKHFGNRLQKKVGVAIPPVPISEYCHEPDESGIIMRYMFPARGKVVSGAAKIDGFPKGEKRISLVADIQTPDEAIQKFFDLKNRVDVFQIDLPVDAGSRFTLRLDDPEVEVSKIWIAFLYHIEPGKTKLHEMLVDQLEEIDPCKDLE